MHDLYHNILPLQVLKPATVTTAQTSSAGDLQGFGSAAMLFCVGLSADSLSGSVYWTLRLQHSDDNVDYANVAASDVHNAADTIVIDSAAEDEQVYAIGYKGAKRYVKGIATPTGSHSSGTPIAMVLLRANPSYSPVV
jgi:hypothetical protein